MHTIHTTLGFIVGSRPYGDAGKILSVFTRDFGLVYATAQGIRLEKSKLRYYVQDYSFGTYSMVKGREYWRMTSANSPIEHSAIGPSNYLTIRSGSRGLITRIALLLRRLLHGEEAHPELFDCVFECTKFLALGNMADVVNETLSGEDLQTLESLVVARILYALGYIGDVGGLNEEMRSVEIDIGLLRRLNGEGSFLNEHINKALKESML
jgi:hypothetical protein